MGTRHAVVAIATFATMLLWRPLLLGELPWADDLATQYYPMREMLCRSLRDGEVPSWNPYQLTGMPFLADPQVEAFYPSTALCYFFAAPVALVADVWLHWVLAGAGAYLWLRRRLKTPETESAPVAALAGAAAYAFGGFLVVHYMHLGHLAAAAWLPWLWLALGEVARARSVRSIALLALPVGLMLLAGNSQILSYAVLFGFAHTAFDIAARTQSGARLAAILAWGWRSGCGVVAGALLAALQVLPTADLVAHSARDSQASWDYTSSYSLEPTAWPLALVPDLLGRGDGPGFDGPWNSWEMTSYVGVLPLALAAIALMARRRGSGGYPLGPAVIAGTAALLMALGRWGGLQYLLVHALPGFRFFRAPCRSIVVVALCVAELAAVGLVALTDVARTRTRAAPTRDWRRLAFWWAVVASVALLLGGAASHWLWSPGLEAAVRQERWIAVGRFALLAAGAAWLVERSRTGHLRPPSVGRVALALIALDLGMQWAPYLTTRSAAAVLSPTPIERLAREVAGNGRLLVAGEGTRRMPTVLTELNLAGMRHGFRNVGGYSPLIPRHVHRALTAQMPQPPGVEVSIPRFASPHPSLLRLGVRAVMLPVDYAGPMPGGARLLAEDGIFALLAVPPAPRAQVVDASGRPAGSAEIEEEGTDYIRLRVCADQSARLVLYDADYPGWTAAVDGVSAEIARVDGAFRSVAVAAGCRHVAFSYRERRLALGGAISALAALALLVAVVQRGRARKT